MCFNSSDPSGAAGLSADMAAVASVGLHGLPILTGAYVGDSAAVFDHYSIDDDAVREQAQAVLEDIHAPVIKIGFAGSPDNLAAIAAIASDYADITVLAYMPDLSWWGEVQTDLYLDAYKDLVLPQVTVLVGNHNTLWRWLLPDWSDDLAPGARDIARAAHEHGVAYTVVTGIALANQCVDNVLASPTRVLANQQFERFDAPFSGAGDTFSAALAALLASGTELTDAFAEALWYLDRSLESGFRPGMGHLVPDRYFWSEPDEMPATDVDGTLDPLLTSLELPHEKKH